MKQAGRSYHKFYHWLHSFSKVDNFSVLGLAFCASNIRPKTWYAHLPWCEVSIDSTWQFTFHIIMNRCYCFFLLCRRIVLVTVWKVTFLFLIFFLCLTLIFVFDFWKECSSSLGGSAYEGHTSGIPCTT